MGWQMLPCFVKCTVLVICVLFFWESEAGCLGDRRTVLRGENQQGD